jgi:hypothetical protein
VGKDALLRAGAEVEHRVADGGRGAEPFRAVAPAEDAERQVLDRKVGVGVG